MTTPPATRRCRSCGCTDEDCSQCIAATGEPCSWVERDLCSRCVGSSPVPAGTEREALDRVLALHVKAFVEAPYKVEAPWQQKNHTTRCYAWADGYNAALSDVRAAAVVSSSPATPAEDDECCGQMCPGWDDPACGYYPRNGKRPDSCAGPSPATPEGGRR